MSLKLFNSNIYFKLLQADISNLEIEIVAIVNCTGPYFNHQSGVSAAITRAAGSELEDEYNEHIEKYGELKWKEVKCTPAYDMAAWHNYILHVRSPSTIENDDMCQPIYLSILKKAFIELNCTSLALPLIGTGNNQLDVEKSFKGLVEAIRELLDQYKNKRLLSTRCDIYVVNNNKKQFDEIKILVDELCKSQTKPSSNVNSICQICLDELNSDSSKRHMLTICKHEFCKDCINEWFKSNKSCPICKTVYGKMIGNQPMNGTMTSRIINESLPGYYESTIEIVYNFPGGIQQSNHPNPGRSFSGITRMAYLPNTTSGQQVLELLKRAFDQKLTFTIGVSRTTGQDGVITWNDIHHKTSKTGGPVNFGYPDPTYLARVRDELSDKGIV